MATTLAPSNLRIVMAVPGAASSAVAPDAEDASLPEVFTNALSQSQRAAKAISRLHADLYKDACTREYVHTCGPGECSGCGARIIDKNAPRRNSFILKCAVCREWICSTCSRQAKLSIACPLCDEHCDEITSFKPKKCDDIFPVLEFDQTAATREWWIDLLAEPDPEEIVRARVRERARKRARKSAGLDDEKEPISNQPVCESIESDDEKEMTFKPAPCPLAAQAAAERAARWPGTRVPDDEARSWAFERTRSTELHTKKYIRREIDIFKVLKVSAYGIHRFPCGCAVRCEDCGASHVCRYGTICPRCICTHIKQNTEEVQWKRIKFAGVMHVLGDDRLKRNLID